MHHMHIFIAAFAGRVARTPVSVTVYQRIHRTVPMPILVPTEYRAPLIVSPITQEAPSTLTFYWNNA